MSRYIDSLRVDAIGGVQVERRFEAARVDGIDKTLRVGK